jgi:hypothetical protein
MNILVFQHLSRDDHFETAVMNLRLKHYDSWQDRKPEGKGS